MGDMKWLMCVNCCAKFFSYGPLKSHSIWRFWVLTTPACCWLSLRTIAENMLAHKSRRKYIIRKLFSVKTNMTDWFPSILPIHNILYNITTWKLRFYCNSSLQSWVCFHHRALRPQMMWSLHQASCQILRLHILMPAMKLRLHRTKLILTEVYNQAITNKDRKILGELRTSSQVHRNHSKTAQIVPPLIATFPTQRRYGESPSRSGILRTGFYSLFYSMFSYLW